MTLRDAAALLRLQREIDREAALQAAGTTAQWEASLREMLWAARRHLAITGSRSSPTSAPISTSRLCGGPLRNGGLRMVRAGEPDAVAGADLLAGRQADRKWLLAISAVSGSRARCRHQGPAVDKDARCKRDIVFRATKWARRHGFLIRSRRGHRLG